MGKSKELATLTDVGGTIDGALTVDGGYTDLETQDVNNYARITTVNGSAQLGLYRSGSAEGGFYLGGDVDKFRVYDSSFTPRMEVDASGRVTMPYQPWAFVDMGGGGSYVTMSGVLPYDNIVQSTGSHYNTSTYQFTCPVDGVYSVAWSVLSQNNSDQFHVHVLHNGVRFARAYQVYRTNRGYVEIKCQTNDYLSLASAESIGVYPDTGIDRYTWATYRFLG